MIVAEEPPENWYLEQTPEPIERDAWSDWSDAHLQALIKDAMAMKEEVLAARTEYISRGLSRY